MPPLDELEVHGLFSGDVDVATLCERLPRPTEMKEDAYKRNLAARAFDVARYLLPTATYTGLGYLLSFAQANFNAALTLALVGLIVTFVLILLGVAGWVERRALRWR